MTVKYIHVHVGVLIIDCHFSPGRTTLTSSQRKQVKELHVLVLLLGLDT